MAEMNVRSDAVDVEQIMRQIRARIREKRGVDYTEAELQQLAQVKLEKFLDPRGVRSDLVERFRADRMVAPAPPNYEFEEDTLFETHRGPLRALRNLLRPILKLFLNPDKITSALHIQAHVNSQGEQRLRRLEDREPLYYELIHNLTLEVTRLGIEAHNLRMRVESLSSRLDFDERRARALEGAVQFRPPSPRPAVSAPVVAPTPSAEPAAAGTPAADVRPSGPDGGAGNGERRRRRRRRRRRPGRTLADSSTQPQGGDADTGGDAADQGYDDGPDTDGSDDTDASDQ